MLTCFAWLVLVAVAVMRARVTAKKALVLLPMPRVLARVRFERPLDLGLTILHKEGERAGVASVHQADDLERTLGLFTRSVRAALADAAKLGEVEVSDEEVTIALDEGASASRRTEAELAAHRLRLAIDEARADLLPPRTAGSVLPAFRAAAARFGGQVELCPLSVTFRAATVPVVLAAERVHVGVFHVRASVRFAPAGSGRDLPERMRRFLEGGSGRCSLDVNDGIVMLWLGAEPDPGAIAASIRRLLRFARLLSEPALSHATPYRDSREAVRARSAA